MTPADIALIDRPLDLDEDLWVLPIAGTEGWGDAWWQDDSPWLLALEQAHCRALRIDTLRGLRPFRWSTDLDGVNAWDSAKNLIRGAFHRTKAAVVHRDWEAGGDSCASFLQDVPYLRRNLIAHSFGGNVGIYAALDRRIRTLVTVGTPVREDMREIYQAARPNIGRHLHICDDTFDLWGTAGQLLDGDVRIARTFPVEWDAQPDLQETIHAIGHGKILRDPQRIPYWVSQGWLTWIRRGPGRVSVVPSRA